MTAEEKINKEIEEDTTEDREKMEKILLEIQKTIDRAEITPVQVFGILEFLKMRLFNRTDEFAKEIMQIIRKEKEKPSE